MDEKLRKNLECPITLETFVDPVNVPCCGQAFSRHAITAVKICPMCNADLTQFDAGNAARNVNLASMIDDMKHHDEERKKKQAQQQGTLQRIIAPNGKLLKRALLTLNLYDPDKFNQQAKSRLIVVVDSSGSMAGQPFAQVQQALRQLLNMSAYKTDVATTIIVYSDITTVIPTRGRKLDDLILTIQNLRPNGGTNFELAFLKVGEILADSQGQDQDDQKEHVSIVFMTDGEVNVGMKDKSELVKLLKATVSKKHTVVHTVGFGGNCDRELLEQMRMAGSEEGMFRYAEPQTQDEQLCTKLSSLFDIVFASKNSRYGCAIAFPDEISTNEDTTCVSLQINAAKKRAVCTLWVDVQEAKQEEEDAQISAARIIKVGFSDGQFIDVPVVEKREKDVELFEKWINIQIDQFASDVLDSAKLPQPIVFNAKLRLCLLRRRMALALTHVRQETQQRLQFLLDQIQQLLQGAQVNMGQLADVRFGSHFVVIAPKQKEPSPPNKMIEQEGKAVVAFQAEFDKTRKYGNMQYDIESVLKGKFLEPLDGYQNTALHFAAARGQVDDVRELLTKFGSANEANADDETPLTLAIKTRGYFKTVAVLQAFGAAIPAHRIEGIKTYCKQNFYQSTLAALLRGAYANAVDVTCSATLIENTLKEAIETKTPIDLQHFLEIGCKKKMCTMVRNLLHQCGAVADFKMFLQFCIPPKPDDPNVHQYLTLADLFLQQDLTLVTQSDVDTQETALLKAVETGNREHVELFVKLAPQMLECKNKLGNTALWIATAKAYPCIVDVLLREGADVNATNLKGNPPLYNVCQRGPLKIALKLLEHRANVEFVNSNGDTSILLCARNGQVPILQALLKHVSLSFVNQSATIDGFNALFASVEQDRPLCIDMLLEEFPDLDLNQRTSIDNHILASATPLHLASFYGRIAACRKLLECKASHSSLDANHATPLHVAVMQGRIEIVRLLVSAGANVHARDAFFNSPISYAKSRPEILRLLEDPLLECMVRLSKGIEDCNPEVSGILTQNAQLDRFLTASDVLDVKDVNGSNPLMQAVLYSNAKMCALLVSKNLCDIFQKNIYGLSAASLVHWIENKRIIPIFREIANMNHFSSQQDVACMNLEEASGPGSYNVLRSLHVVPEKSQLSMQANSGLGRRMQAFLEHFASPPWDIQKPGEEKFEVVKFEKFFCADLSGAIPERCVFDAKVHLVNLVAAAKQAPLTPHDLFILVLYANNDQVIDFLEEEAHFIHRSFMMQMLTKLPAHVGEVFIGASAFIAHRSEMTIGCRVQFHSLLSASTLFSVALQQTPFVKEGTVFLIKTKTARFVAPYVQFPYEAEVVLLPTATYKVAKWYEGNVIALGQANIRDQTFGLKTKDECRPYFNTNKALIIELQEE